MLILLLVGVLINGTILSEKLAVITVNMQLKQKGPNFKKFKTQCQHSTPVSSMYYIFSASCGVIIKKVVRQDIFWLDKKLITVFKAFRTN